MVLITLCAANHNRKEIKSWDFVVFLSCLPTLRCDHVFFLVFCFANLSIFHICESYDSIIIIPCFEVIIIFLSLWKSSCQCIGGIRPITIAVICADVMCASGSSIEFQTVLQLQCTKRAYLKQKPKSPVSPTLFFNAVYDSALFLTRTLQMNIWMDLFVFVFVFLALPLGKGRINRWQRTCL